MDSTKNLPVVLSFQDVEISCPIENGHRMIPIKTICSIIDVDFKSEDTWLKEHSFFSQLYRLSPTVGADGKQREMNCLSIFDVDGWLHSITLKGRKPGSVDKQYAFLTWLREKKLELYKSIELFIEENRYELELIEKKGRLVDALEECQDKTKELRNELKKVNGSIEDVRRLRYTGQTALPFPPTSDAQNN